MTPTRFAPGTLALVLGAFVVAGAGAGGMYLFLRGGSVLPAATQPAVAPPAAAAREIAIALTPEAASRAGIHTAGPTLGQLGATFAVPGVVEANGYKQVVVRSVAPGQVRSVAVDLGAEVRRGGLLATIHTPDLAETVRAYLSMSADLEAALQRLSRTEGLVKIGAASQQELETAKADHIRRATDVESAEAKLSLLGVPTKELSHVTAAAVIDSTVRVTSPIDGVVIARSINEGANIDASADLFTVVDLSAVWVVANLYERDLSRVKVGSTATITSSAATGQSWTGRVSYIDPHLAHDTRTAKVRVDVTNPSQALRLGMYTDVVFSASAPANALLIPRSAIQTIGSQTVVYLSDSKEAGRYLERPVALGSASGEKVEVLSGLSESDEVVISGSFALRAERERLGFPPPVAIAPATSGDTRKIEIDITKEGFSPNSVDVEAGSAIELVFTRRTDDTCATEVVVPSTGARKSLPLNQQVSIRLPPATPGTLSFACGMDMLRGSIVVR